VHAVFCGAKADNYETVITEIEKLNLESQIQYIGFVSRAELVGLYKKAVALVMPAFFGHANIPVMEAFALGCPVTVSNVHALPEEVGDAALLFKPDDIHDMAHKIEMLWTDEELRRNFIERGYQKYLRQDQVAFNVRFKEILLHAALVKINTRLA
jgi:glycosyltransferase involved in cell wall biosynthesis